MASSSALSVATGLAPDTEQEDTDTRDPVKWCHTNNFDCRGRRTWRRDGKRSSALEGDALMDEYHKCFFPPSNSGPRRHGATQLATVATRLPQAPPSYFDLEGELDELHQAFRDEGSYLLKHPLLDIRISLHCIERMIARGVRLSTLAQIFEFGIACGVQSVGHDRIGKWTMNAVTFHKPKFHGHVHYTIILGGVGHIEVAMMGEAGQTAAGHVRVQLSIETVCIPGPERVVDRSEGFGPLVAMILQEHRRDYTIRRAAALTAQTRTDYRVPSDSFEPQGAEILAWIERDQVARQARIDPPPPAPKALARVAPQPPWVPAPPPRAAAPIPVLAAPRPALPPAKSAAPRPVRAPPLPSPQPALGAAPPPALAAPPPAKAVALWLPADPWDGPAFTLRSEGGTGPFQRAAVPRAPVVLVQQSGGLGEWMFTNEISYPYPDTCFLKETFLCLVIFPFSR